MFGVISAGASFSSFGVGFNMQVGMGGMYSTGFMGSMGMFGGMSSMCCGMGPMVPFGGMPMMMPPSIAPSMEPIPPRTAATKAFNPGWIPMKAVSRG